VSGATANTTTAQITFNGFMIGKTDASIRNLLWNYYQATSLSLQGGMLGSVLAPNAAVTGGFGSSTDSRSPHPIAATPNFTASTLTAT
jgi:choice-of-anchor A domain-containing protein